MEDIRNASWCEQLHNTGEGYDAVLYMGNKKETCSMEDISERNAYDIIVKLKQRVPHLMYGPNREYYKLFKKDPSQLLALAKSRMTKG